MASIHERIVNVLRDTATIVNPDGRFIYGREVHNTLDYPNMSLASSAEDKALISLLPFTITKTNNPDNNYDSAAISMVFSRSADVQDNAAKEEAILNEMAALAETYIYLLIEASKPITYSLSDVQMQAEYQVWMGTASGYVVTFTFSIKQECELPTIQGLQTTLQSLLQS